MDLSHQGRQCCSVCVQRFVKSDIILTNTGDINLALLRNDALPLQTLPSTYNFKAYDKAILYPKGIHNRQSKGPMDICKTCYKYLKKQKQPLSSLANFQYYARDKLPPSVKEAFANASMFDIILVARCRATHIADLYSKKWGSPIYGYPSEMLQSYTKGNVAILPQDTINL